MWKLLLFRYMYVLVCHILWYLIAYIGLLACYITLNLKNSIPPPFPIARQPDKQLIRIRDHFLDENLLIVLLTKWATIIGSRVTYVGLHCLQRHYFKRGFRRRARLGRDHPSKTRHTPSAHMVVFRAHRNQVLLREGHLKKENNVP